MIKNKSDLKRYLEMDRYALGRGGRPKWIGDYIYKFEISLRYHEYYHNIIAEGNSNLLNRLKLLYWKYRHNRLGLLLGFEIPINVFDAGLRINHRGLLIVNKHVKIGKYCDIHQGVNIGMQGDSNRNCPTIGDNVWIGPGAKLFGKIVIGNNNQIGANAVVNKSFVEDGIAIAGVPAKKISNNPNPYVRNYLLNE